MMVSAEMAAAAEVRSAANVSPAHMGAAAYVRSAAGVSAEAAAKRHVVAH